MGHRVYIIIGTGRGQSVLDDRAYALCPTTTLSDGNTEGGRTEAGGDDES